MSSEPGLLLTEEVESPQPDHSSPNSSPTLSPTSSTSSIASLMPSGKPGEQLSLGESPREKTSSEEFPDEAALQAARQQEQEEREKKSKNREEPRNRATQPGNDALNKNNQQDPGLKWLEELAALRRLAERETAEQQERETAEISDPVQLASVQSRSSLLDVDDQKYSPPDEKKDAKNLVRQLNNLYLKLDNTYPALYEKYHPREDYIDSAESEFIRELSTLVIHLNTLLEKNKLENAGDIAEITLQLVEELQEKDILPANKAQAVAKYGELRNKKILADWQITKIREIESDWERIYHQKILKSPQEIEDIKNTEGAEKIEEIIEIHRKAISKAITHYSDRHPSDLPLTTAKTDETIEVIKHYEKIKQDAKIAAIRVAYSTRYPGKELITTQLKTIIENPSSAFSPEEIKTIEEEARNHIAVEIKKIQRQYKIEVICQYWKKIYPISTQQFTETQIEYTIEHGTLPDEIIKEITQQAEKRTTLAYLPSCHSEAELASAFTALSDQAKEEIKKAATLTSNANRECLTNQIKAVTNDFLVPANLEGIEEINEIAHRFAAEDYRRGRCEKERFITPEQIKQMNQLAKIKAIEEYWHDCREILLTPQQKQEIEEYGNLCVTIDKLVRAALFTLLTAAVAGVVVGLVVLLPVLPAIVGMVAAITVGAMLVISSVTLVTAEIMLSRAAKHPAKNVTLLSLPTFVTAAAKLAKITAGLKLEENVKRPTSVAFFKTAKITTSQLQAAAEQKSHGVKTIIPLMPPPFSSFST